MPPPRHEVEHLADLLGDFGADGWGADRADEAFDLVARRSETLGAFIEEDARLVADLADDLPLADVAEAVGRSVHGCLFGGLLRNAGHYRDARDAGGGRIQFGGTRHQTTQPRYRGSSPPQIERDATQAYHRLTDVRTDASGPPSPERAAARLAATDAAVLFYKDISGVHPFYDANGRVGRYVVSVYLLLHGRALGRPRLRRGPLLEKDQRLLGPPRCDGRRGDDGALRGLPDAVLAPLRGRPAGRSRPVAGVRAVFHRPHPQRETDKGALTSMRRFLREAGVQPE